jgi:phosphohistidine phosphatase
MHTLTLMRHAKSSWDDPALSDHDRPLNARGNAAADTMAARLKDSGYRPDLLIASSALRAQETAKAIQKAYAGLALRTEPLLYEAPPSVYADVIRRLPEHVNDVMIVGHNPAMEWMAEALSGGFLKVPTAAYLRVGIPGKWEAFHFEPFERLAYDFPKSDR